MLSDLDLEQIIELRELRAALKDAERKNERLLQALEEVAKYGYEADGTADIAREALQEQGAEEPLWNVTKGWDVTPEGRRPKE